MEIIELYGHLRPLGAKAGDGGGHQYLGGNAKANAQGAAVACQHIAGSATELLAGRYQGAGIFIERPPQHCEPGGTGIALEQLAAKLLLQPFYLLAQGRLGDVLAHRRLTEVQHFPRVTKAFESLSSILAPFIPIRNVEWLNLSLDGILELFDAYANSFGAP